MNEKPDCVVRYLKMMNFDRTLVSLKLLLTQCQMMIVEPLNKIRPMTMSAVRTHLEIDIK